MIPTALTAGGRQQPLGAVGPGPHDREQAAALLLQACPQINAVRPHVDGDRLPGIEGQLGRRSRNLRDRGLQPPLLLLGDTTALAEHDPAIEGGVGAGDGALEKAHLGAGSGELLDQQSLVGVLAVWLAIVCSSRCWAEETRA